MTVLKEAIAKASVDYGRDGVCLISQVFSKEEMLRLKRGACMSLMQGPEINQKGYKHVPIELVDSEDNPSPALIFWPSLVNHTMDQFRTDPRLQSIVREFLGGDVKQLNNQFYFRLPGDGDSFAWHQDIMFRHPRSEYPGIVEQNSYLQTAIIVDEMKASNGGIQYLLGSHRKGDMDLVPANYQGLRGFDKDKHRDRLSGFEGRIFDASPGDVLLWSSLTVHGSEPNFSDQSRMYYMNGFARAENCRPWPWYMKNGLLQSLIPEDIP